MTRLESILEHYAGISSTLCEDAKLCRPRPGDREPVTLERVALCAARKADQLRRMAEYEREVQQAQANAHTRTLAPL